MPAVYGREDLLAKVHPVIDPELNFSVVDLGLIYGIEQHEDGTVRVEMTLTSPMCPIGPSLGKQVEEALLADPQITGVDLQWTFSPPWDPRTMATDEVRWELGIFT